MQIASTKYGLRIFFSFLFLLIIMWDDWNTNSGSRAPILNSVNFLSLPIFKEQNRISSPIIIHNQYDISALNVKIPGISTYLIHKLDLLYSYNNSIDGGAPSSCSPVLQNGRFPASIRDIYRRGLPLNYDDILNERYSIQVWVTSGINTTLNNDKLVYRARMVDHSVSVYCQNQKHFSSDFVPAAGCPQETPPFNPPYSYPWCFPPTDPVHIVSLDCGIVENFFGYENFAFTILNHEVIASAQVDNEWKKRPTEEVVEFDELATMGSTMYPTEPGHFLNEGLHALLYLDYALPSRIPLLWPEGNTASHVYESLKEEGLLNQHRQFIFVNRHIPSFFRAKRLYFFRSNHGFTDNPVVTWYTHQFMRKLLLPVVKRRLIHTKITEESRRLSVVVFKRSIRDTRYLTNHKELVDGLSKWIPNAKIQSFIPGANTGHPFWETAERIHSSCLVIGVHGANMPNFWSLNPGCWVIEIGYVDISHALISDFYCFARNLGLEYWLSIGTGKFMQNVTADINDIMEIVKIYKRDMLGRSV